MSKPEKTLNIALALVEYGGKILLLQRRDTQPEWDKRWEFPGGKIEPNELPVDAAVRELREETGLEACEAELALIHPFTWDLPERILHVNLHCVRCRSEQDQVQTESDRAYGHEWVAPLDALSYDLLQANAEVIQRVFLRV